MLHVKKSIRAILMSLDLMSVPNELYYTYNIKCYDWPFGMHSFANYEILVDDALSIACDKQ